MINSGKIIPIYEKEFYHDGRGPTLKKVIWGRNGILLKGFDFVNPNEKKIKHILLENVEAFAFADEEVHSNILISNKLNAAIYKVENSKWKKSFNQQHINECHHYQIIFYDEIYDVICKNIKLGLGQLK